LLFNPARGGQGFNPPAGRAGSRSLGVIICLLLDTPLLARLGWACGGVVHWGFNIQCGEDIWHGICDFFTRFCGII